jgi:N6-L-threonylcarbamoyladenine synthase
MILPRAPSNITFTNVSPGSMWLRPLFQFGTARTRVLRKPQWSLRRRLMTLAIETSCDDTGVAIVEKTVGNGRPLAILHFHKKVTANNAEYKGVHPLVSLQSHQESLANLVSEAISHLPRKTLDGSNAPNDGGSHEDRREGTTDVGTRRLPDFISVTRGPGMRSNLFTGLDTAKGLAVAWQVLIVNCFTVAS